MNTSIEKSEEERKKCTCSLKGVGQGGGQALVGEGRMAAGQGPAASVADKAAPPLAAGQGPAASAGGKARPPAGQGPAPSTDSAGGGTGGPRRALPSLLRGDRSKTGWRRPSGGAGGGATRRRAGSGALARGLSAPRYKKMAAAAAWTRMEEEEEERERWARVTCWAA